MKSLKFPGENKEVNIFDKKLRSTEYEQEITAEEEQATLIEIQQNCEALRQQRMAKLTEIMGSEEAFRHSGDNITEYELWFELSKSLSVPPERRYQIKKKNWQSHGKHVLRLVVLRSVAFTQP
jgi:hypothetical protein